MTETQMFEAVGRCILAWAGVELQLQLAFLHLCGGGSTRAAQVFDRVRSFDAKMQSLNDIARAVLKEKNELRDWRIVHDHAMALYKLRNKVAHSAMLQKPDTVELSPFFSVTGGSTPSERLSVSDVDRFTDQFRECRGLIHWFEFDRLGKQHQEFQVPEPDLMRRLRTEDDRRIEAQRHRAEAWRQYLARNPEVKL